MHDYEEDDDLDQIYKITTYDEDWINSTRDGRITWDKDSSCTSDSDEELEHWQNQLHEISLLRCYMLTKSLQCISTEVWHLHYYDDLEDVNLILDKSERDVPKEQWFQDIDIVL